MQVKNTQDNLQKCICGGCPTYDECMKGGAEGLFCARQKSNCDFEKKGCTCGECPMTTENNLSGGYYCESGVAS